MGRISVGDTDGGEPALNGARVLRDASTCPTDSAEAPGTERLVPLPRVTKPQSAIFHAP